MPGFKSYRQARTRRKLWSRSLSERRNWNRPPEPKVVRKPPPCPGKGRLVTRHDDSDDMLGWSFLVVWGMFIVYSFWWAVYK